MVTVQFYFASEMKKIQEEHNPKKKAKLLNLKEAEQKKRLKAEEEKENMTNPFSVDFDSIFL
jgi:hypothetical protein